MDNNKIFDLRYKKLMERKVPTTAQLREIVGDNIEFYFCLEGEVIVFTRDLTPSEEAQLKVLAIELGW